MNKPFLACVLLAAAGYAAWIYADKGTTNPFAPVPSTPVAPAPIRGAYVVVCSQPNCPPCERLKADLNASPLTRGVDIRYSDITKAHNRRIYKVAATPTSILFLAGKETKRKEGYMSPEEFIQWVGTLQTSTPVRELEDE